MGRYSGVIVLLIGIGCLLGLTMLLSECPSRGDGSGLRRGCLNNLKQLGGFLLTYDLADEIARVPGADYVLQVGRDLTPQQHRAFHCPGDPTPADEHRCSYRGPDEWLLELQRSRGDGRRDYPYVACDANGPAGDEPYHEDGVCVLCSSGSVEFVRWEDMQGYAGGPVKIGPGSPDPRFRHLIR